MSHAVRPYSTFPSTDLVFRRAVEIAITHTRDLRGLLAVLRVEYPNVTVVEQTEFARYGDEPLAVYVFRDGSFAAARVERGRGAADPAA